MFLFKKKNNVEKKEKEIDKVMASIHRKCAYGEQLQVLNETEQNLYLTELFQSEIENGGFRMLFFHLAGSMMNDMVSSLKAIGAMKCAQLLQEALAMFPEEITTMSKEQSQNLLKEHDPEENLFFELNEALSAMGEDVSVYRTAYMLRHKHELL